MGRRAVVIRHETPVGLGNFGPVLEEQGWEMTVVDARGPDFGAQLAESADAELVIVLGSTAGVYEEHAFIPVELAALRDRIDRRLPTLGVCFGAQAIAAALGEDVRPGGQVEVGYRSVTPTAAGLSSPVRHFAGVPAAEWHGDTFTLPPATTLLASSAAYENEAFGIERWLLAVQFHPELTDAMHEEWLIGDAAYVAAAGYDPDALRLDRERYGQAMQEASRRMLVEYLDGITENDGS